MIVSLNWLKEYIDLENISVEEIEEKLTTAGLEVEEVIDQAKLLEDFVVAYVKDKKKHPNADKLSLCEVSDGIDQLNVVCGAPNVEAGQKVAFARVGAIIPNGEFKIKKAKIRGEASFGMICSERELNLSESHEGIMVIDDKWEIGSSLAEALGQDDVIFDIAITPNRADSFSHIGIARDLSALLDRPLKFPELKLNELEEKSEDLASVEIENTESCSRYVGKVVKDITVKESPEWLKKKLISIGLRPINNVVDITNFVLHEIGQPLHAFDLDKLADSKIIVKNAKEGDKFTTLDDKERKLAATDLMICDGEKSVAIAGVMGGENSEVSEKTKNILIESAYFDPSSVRKTAKKLSLSTDASFRFERGCDPEITIWAAKRCAQLLSELADGKVLSGEIDVYPNVIEHKKVKARFARINKVLGYKIENEDVKKIFTNLGFGILEENDEYILVDVPTNRHDIEREIDLIEEVARIYGYDNIPAVEKIAVTLHNKIDESDFTNKIKDIFCGFGFYETITNSLLNEYTADLFGKSISVLNPQNSEMSNLRTSLIPGTLSTISKNLKVKENSLRLFEVGKIFNKKSEKIDSFDDFVESENILITLAGKSENNSWYSKETIFDIYDLKGFVDEFLRKISLDKILKDNYYQKGDEIFEYKYTKSFRDQIVGIGGKIKTDVLKKFDINQEVLVFNFNIDLLKGLNPGINKFKELLKFPKMVRDFSVVLDRTTDSVEVQQFISKNSSQLMRNVDLFDVFEHESLGSGKKSLAYQLEYFDENKTLTDQEVDKDFWNVIEKVKKEFKAELRG